MVVMITTIEECMCGSAHLSVIRVVMVTTIEEHIMLGNDHHSGGAYLL